MKKSVATKWVKALRSGKYKQTSGALRNDEGFCCLGVLSDIYDETGWGPLNTKGYFRYKKCNQGLAKSVIKWSEMITHSQTDIKRLDSDGSKKVFLATKNDEGWSFRKIANWIEKNWKKL